MSDVLKKGDFGQVWASGFGLREPQPAVLTIWASRASARGFDDLDFGRLSPRFGGFGIRQAQSAVWGIWDSAGSAHRRFIRRAQRAWFLRLNSFFVIGPIVVALGTVVILTAEEAGVTEERLRGFANDRGLFFLGPKVTSTFRTTNAKDFE